MLRVGIGSTNPAKINAVRAAFEMLEWAAEVTGIDMESGVSAQPFSDEETILGAVLRAKSVMAAGNSEYDYGIGLEGGVVETPHGLFLCNWGAVADRQGKVGIGGGHRVQLPPAIVESLYNGEEMKTVIDRLIGDKDIHQKEGTIGVLTHNRITRQSMFRDVVICALARFLNPELYREGGD